MEEIKKENFIFIDVSKVIAIFLIIFGHICPINSPLGAFIYSFHLATFFILAGFLYHHRTKKENLDKILWALIIPYFLYQIIYFPFKFGNYVLFHDYNYATTFLQMLNGIFIANTRTTEYSLVVCGPCWFIVCMIWLRLLPLKIKFTTFKILSISLFSILIAYFLNNNHIILPFTLCSVFMAIPFFLFGLYLQNFNISILLKKINSICRLILSLILFSLTYFLSNFNGLYRIAAPWDNIGDPSLILFYIEAFCGFSGIILISSLVQKDYKFINILSKNTLFIIFFHWFLLFFIKWVGIIKYISSFQSTDIRVIFTLILTILILILNYFAILVLQKYCPILLGKYRTKT